jgi:hypothetical protein
MAVQSQDGSLQGTLQGTPHSTATLLRADWSSGCSRKEKKRPGLGGLWVVWSFMVAIPRGGHLLSGGSGGLVDGLMVVDEGRGRPGYRYLHG